MEVGQDQTLPTSLVDAPRTRSKKRRFAAVVFCTGALLLSAYVLMSVVGPSSRVVAWAVYSVRDMGPARSARDQVINVPSVGDGGVDHLGGPGFTKASTARGPGDQILNVPSGAQAAMAKRAPAQTKMAEAEMTAITDNVKFNTVAREWRCKWSGDDDKKSLAELQKALDDVLPTLKAMKGAEVQRVVCGGCLDFKVITSVAADDFGGWEEKGFAPEEDFLKKIKGIDGVTQCETQTFTLMPM